MLCRPRTTETVKTFRLTASRSAGTVALVMTDLRSDQTDCPNLPRGRTVSGVGNPLRHGANLFVDVLDLMDGYGPAGEPVGAAKETQKAAKASSITLRTLTRRAQRLASDGTGIGVRFQGARDPWNKLSRHVLTSVVRPDDGHIIGVRESRNWNRNQPNALVPADPQAWYVNVSNRSNQQKDAVSLPWTDGGAGSLRRREGRRDFTQEHRGQSRVPAPPRGRPLAGRLQHARLPQQRELRFLDPRADHTRQRRYAIVPGAPSVSLRFSHAKWRVFACKRSDHGENISPCRAPASAVRDSLA